MTSRQGAHSRRLPPSPARRAAGLVLAVGTVVAGAAAFGSLWVVRAGLAVALAAMALSCALAWRELRLQRRRHAAESIAATRAHGQALRTERQHNAAVLQVLTDRHSAAVAELSRQTTVIAGLRTEIATLRGDNVALRSTVVRQDAAIGELRETVRAREAEVASFHSRGTDDAEVHTMPRRVRVETDPAAGEDLQAWADGDHPTVVDLAMVEVPVLPNFEADRRLA